ncbi:c6 transcription factor [Trichoderma arundinaceum]|uniref:C6 transcription factor n=1 Tax=Trichoderma arundinaceum TaxID=490622 RepID=A0A395NC54_TRIAR|nr:c6 transcription factor [Trichoderma arundinaceum]
MSSLKHLLSAKVRSQSGCYTCRLRRKKCDERRPVCSGCAALEITCYFGDLKPDWMDGGPKQKEMAEFVKSQVKKQASQRRDRKYLEMLETGTRKVSISGGPDEGAGKAGDLERGYASTSAPSTKESPISHVSGSTAATSPPEVPWHTQVFNGGAEEQDEYDHSSDIHYACMYLDYVFPHLFPHYRPHILVGGRGWVLDTLQSNNKSLYHITVSLASYYFALILNNGEPEHDECMRKMNENLQTQMELGLRELQREVSSLHSRKMNPREGLIVMESIIQLLIFEVAVGNRDNWKLHLDAAIALFRQVLPNADDWEEMLYGLVNTRWPPPEMGMKRPWSTSQAACRFFTANLLYIDVLSSVTLGCPPRLYNYQNAIIPSCKTTEWSPCTMGEGPLRMEEFRGLHNWVLQVIGDIASLHSWKKQQSLAGSLSINELLSRGQVLIDAIKGGIMAIQTSCQEHDTFATVISVPVLGEQPSYSTHNTIWLNAALIYLNTVLSGWQPSCPEIRTVVSNTTELLFNLPRGTCLGALAWPLCVAGCLAPPEDEFKYKSIMARLGGLQLFGSLREAMNIMEQAWARRPLDESWDVAQCMNILGHGVVLL